MRCHAPAIMACREPTRWNGIIAMCCAAASTPRRTMPRVLPPGALRLAFEQSLTKTEPCHVDRVHWLYQQQQFLGDDRSTGADIGSKPYRDRGKGARECRLRSGVVCVSFHDAGRATGRPARVADHEVAEGDDRAAA